MIWPTAPFVHALGHMWFQWEPVLTPWQCWCQLVSGSHQYYRHRTPKSLNVIALVPEQWPDFKTLICDRVFGKEMKNEICWWKMICDVFVITAEMAVPGLCFADHNVCWIHAKKVQRKRCQISESIVVFSSHTALNLFTLQELQTNTTWAMPWLMLQIWQNFTYVHCRVATLVFL